MQHITYTNISHYSSQLLISLISYNTSHTHPADAVAKRYRPWPKGLRADSLPWFDSPLVQGASRLRYTDKAQMQRPGHTGRKALATKKHVTYTPISHHSSLTTHLPPLISHYSALTTHLPPPYTTHLPHLTPFVSHRPSHPLAVSSSHHLIISSSHYLIISSSHHLLIISSSHHLIISSSSHHLLISSSLHHLIISSSHHLIISSSHHLIISSSHHLIISSSHHLIISSSHHLIISSASHHITHP